MPSGRDEVFRLQKIVHAGVRIEVRDQVVEIASEVRAIRQVEALEKEVYVVPVVDSDRLADACIEFYKCRAPIVVVGNLCAGVVSRQET